MAKVPIDKSNEAYRLAQDYANAYPHWRWGQCIFNAYYYVFPEIADEIRGTEDDCFYRDDLVDKFLSHFEVE